VVVVVVVVYAVVCSLSLSLSLSFYHIENNKIILIHFFSNDKLEQKDND
jgi:hypothetical protein